MKRFFSLLYVNLKTGLASTGFTRGRRKKSGVLGKLGTLILILFVAVFLGISFGTMGYNMTMSLKPVGMEKILPGYVVFLGSFLLFFLGFTTTPGVLFFANDLNSYMSMPLHPRDILGAKFLTAVIENFYFVACFLLPVGIGSLIADFSVQALLGWLVTTLLLPIVPTALCTIVLLLVLQFVPFLRNRDRLTHFVGIFTMLLAVGFGLGVQFFNAGDVAGQVMSSGVRNSATFLDQYGIFFPPVVGSQQMIYGENLTTVLMGFGIMVITAVLGFILVMLVAQKLYFRIALGVMSSYSVSKKLSKEQQEASLTQKKTPFAALFHREWQTLMKTPAYFLNAVVPTLLLPLFVLIAGAVAVYVKADVNLPSLSYIRDAMGEFFGGDLQLQLMVGLFVGMGLTVFGSSSGIAASAISRDAKHLGFLKSIPVAAKSIFFSKLSVGILISLIGPVFMILLSLIIVPFFPVLYLTAIVSAIVASYAVSSAELLLDIRWPSLDWTDETRAMKSNRNVMIASLVGYFGVMGVFFAALFLQIELSLIAYLCFGLLLLISMVTLVLYLTRSESMLLRIGDR